MPISEVQFLALYPLFSLAQQGHRSGNPKFDISMSRDDFMNGKNGIPKSAGMKCVFQLLLMTDNYVDMSDDERSFSITAKGCVAVMEFPGQINNKKSPPAARPTGLI